MKHLSTLLAALLIVPSLWGQNVPVQELVLDNGMRLLMVPRKGDPNVSAGWIAKVGSVNERPGITGISHLFEHMMFKGTHTIGTSNIKEELKLIDEMDTVKNELRKEQWVLTEKRRAGFEAGHLHGIMAARSRAGRDQGGPRRFNQPSLAAQQERVRAAEVHAS